MLARLWSNPALERWTRPENRDVARAIASASIGREMEALARRELPTSCPDEDLAAARAAVAFGAPVTVVLQCYRAGHAALWDAWETAVEELVATSARRAVVIAGSAFLFDYVDRCSAWVEQEHTRERERILRGEEQRRMHLVQALLSGAAKSTDGELGYELDAVHVAVVAWGGDAESTLRRIVHDLGADSLTLSVDARTSWGWIRTDAGVGRELNRLVARCPLPDGTRLALGEMDAGLAGFRASHSQARAAQEVAHHRVGPVTRYADIALEALALNDEARARAFVRHELGRLLAAGRREHALCDTLDAYLMSGHNAAAAAARLGVHERTVSNRLRAIEDRLECRISDRGPELGTALRLRRLLEM